MNKINDNKVFLNPGDVVKLKQEMYLSNSPNMIVCRNITKKTYMVGSEPSHNVYKPILGIECLWFDANNTPHICSFNFKDLVLIKKAKDITDGDLSI